MKSNFQIYYKLDEMQFENLWNNALFVFDTNVFLNLYRYTESTRSQLIEIFQKLKDRIWIPHQTILEFHSNRVKVILEQKDSYNNILNILTDVSGEFVSTLDKKIKDYKKQHPSIDVKSFGQRIEQLFSDFSKELTSKESIHPDYMNNDEILDSLTDILDGKTGDPYTQEQLNGIYQEGEQRYKDKFPPGYLDESEKKGRIKYYKDLVIQDMYGDLIIWKQIIDKAKKTQNSIIFVTGDSKEDWWLRIRGRTLGPRTELLNEFITQTAQTFYMYQPEKFIEYAQNYLNQQVNTAAIEEVLQLRKSDEIKNNMKNNDVETKLQLSPEDIIEIEEELAEYQNNKYKRPIRYYQNINYSVGEQIIHKKWGIGIILKVIENNDYSSELTITFPPPIGTKRLLSPFAPISKLINNEDLNKME